jgi:hypothetical protein
MCPAPLTPPDCDLQDFAFMPLQVARLRDSDMAATADPEACWYAVLLWAASWHQLPAASLPNDDAVLARLIGLGRDVRTFRKHKPHALHKFVLCSDGRLYHPVVAEQALEAWERKWQQRWRTECARIKKANQRNGTNLPFPTYEDFRAGAPAPSPQNVPSDVPGDDGDGPEGQTIQGTETGTETGTSEEEAIASLSTEVDAKAEPEDQFEVAWEAYPHVRGRSSKPRSHLAWNKISAARRAVLPAAVRRYADEGREPREDCGAPAFEKWLKDSRYLDWLEASPVVPAGPAWLGPPEIRAAFVAATNEGWARNYVDPADWNNGVLTARNGYAFDQIRKEAPGVVLEFAIDLRKRERAA